MQPSSRLVVVVITAAVVGLGAGAIFGDRSDPPPLPDSVVIDPADSATVEPTVTPSSPGTQAPSAEPVPPRVIDDDDEDEDEDDDDGEDDDGEEDD